jgi:hypothetical protein
MSKEARSTPRDAEAVKQNAKKPNAEIEKLKPRK